MSPISPILKNYPLKQVGNLYQILILSLLISSGTIILEVSSKEILKDTQRHAYRCSSKHYSQLLIILNTEINLNIPSTLYKNYYFEKIM